MNTAMYYMGSPDKIAYVGVSGIVMFGLVVLYCYGAAKLSYDYNIYINNSGYAFMWAFLWYFLPFIYYPYYAIFLNPLVGSAPMTGGRRR